MVQDGRDVSRYLSLLLRKNLGKYLKMLKIMLNLINFSVAAKISSEGKIKRQCEIRIQICSDIKACSKFT